MKKSGQFFKKRTVRDVPLDGQVVLVRADYNVPLDKESGKIADDYRLWASVPTLKYLLEERDAAVVVCSHMGRPDGAVVPALSLKQVATRLEELLGRPVKFLDASLGDKVKVATKNLRPGEILLLENLRFHPEEEANDRTFAKYLAKDTHAKYFVQDGFGVVHRAHASTAAITEFLPSVGGLLLESEYQHILGAMQSPKRPLTAVLGGAKIEDKIEVIDAFIKIADHIVIGGAMANTFLKYRGYNIGQSLAEGDQTKVLDKIYHDAIDKVGKENVDQFIILPTDVAVAEELSPKQPRKEVSINAVHGQERILDIGTHSIHRSEQIIGKSGTVVWNGTLGYAEYVNFSYASARLALHLAKNRQLSSIIGGGDTADFVLHWDKQKGKSFTHVSTGGGASLELMSGKRLPGVEALLKA
jgi:phosphoglycerate kinase